MGSGKRSHAVGLSHINCKHEDTEVESDCNPEAAAHAIREHLIASKERVIREIGQLDQKATIIIKLGDLRCNCY